jgi:hypothetical protein
MGQPLDLRKAFFYGQFVQAAYTMFLEIRRAETHSGLNQWAFPKGGNLERGSTGRTSSLA